MNDWHSDALVARRRLGERMAEAERERLARQARPPRELLRLRVHLDFQLTLGRPGKATG